MRKALLESRQTLAVIIVLFAFAFSSSAQNPITERTLSSWPVKPITETQQSYGDSSLVDFELLFYKDSAALRYTPDEELIEVIYLGYPTVDASDAKTNKRVDRVRKFKSRKDGYLVTFSTVSYVFFKTKRGVTTVLYMCDGTTGYTMINGKLYAEFDLTQGEIFEPTVSEDFFRNRIAWAYGMDH